MKTCVFKIYLFNVKSREMRERERFAMCWFTPVMPKIANVRPSFGHERGTQSTHLTWVAVTQVYEPHLLPPRVHIDRKLPGL